MPIIKPIPGMPGYGASKGGWIYTCKNGKYGFKESWVRLSPYENKRTHYLTVALRVDGHTITYTIHVLVAITWLGPIPKGKEVNHIDGVKRHNQQSNLEYITRKRNLQLAYLQGLSRIPGTKLTPDLVRSIRKAPAELTHRSLSSKFNVSEATIGDVRRMRTWRHVK